MQHIVRLSLAWMRPRQPEPEERPTGPRPVPERARIRLVARIYHAQLKEVERAGRNTDQIRGLQLDALRAFSLELEPDKVDEFMNTFTEESSAVEREWMTHKHSWRSHPEILPTLVTVLTFAVTIFAIVLAIIYAV